MTKLKIYPSITTTRGSNWRKQICDIKKLSLKEICLFPTCLDMKERKRLYRLLKGTPIKRIPLVHLRNDMELWELDYLVKNYKVKAFNIHPLSRYPIINDFSKYKEKIYIENFRQPLNEKEIKQFKGICIDFSHLEYSRLCYPKDYRHNLRLIKKYPHDYAHISAVKYKRCTATFELGSLAHHENKFSPGLAAKYKSDVDKKCYSLHYLGDLSELDYLKRYLSKYRPSVIAIELENSIAEQLQIKKYILKLLK